VAKRAGLHNAHLSLILRGKRGISVEAAARLAVALRVSLKELAQAIPAVAEAKRKGPGS